MARLIDAGKLIEKAYWHGGTPSYDKPYADGHDAVDVEDIENSPTVDAVPYEIVKEWFEEIDKKLDILFEKVGCNTEHIKDGEQDGKVD